MACERERVYEEILTCTEDSDCTGVIVKCVTCNSEGCDKCQITIHTRDGSYCDNCYNYIQIKKHMDNMREYIIYLKSVLYINNIEYDPFPIQ